MKQLDVSALGERGQAWGRQFPPALAQRQNRLSRKEALLSFSDCVSALLLCPNTCSAARGYSVGFPAFPLGLCCTDSPHYAFIDTPPSHSTVSQWVSISVHHLAPASTASNKGLVVTILPAFLPSLAPEPLKTCVSCLQTFLSAFINLTAIISCSTCSKTKSLIFSNSGLILSTCLPTQDFLQALYNSPGSSFKHSVQCPPDSFSSTNIPSNFSHFSIPSQQPLSLSYISWDFPAVRSIPFIFNSPTKTPICLLHHLFSINLRFDSQLPMELLWTTDNLFWRESDRSVRDKQKSETIKVAI